MPEQEKEKSIPSGLMLHSTLSTLKEIIHGVAWSPDGSMLAVAYKNREVQVWDIDTGSIKQQFQGERINYCVAWSPDGRTLVSGEKSFLFLWDIETGEKRSTLQIPGKKEQISQKINKSVAWSPNGQMLASGSDDGLIRLWHPTTGRVICELPGHSKGVNSITWSPNGQTLASSSDDQKICLWNPATGELMGTLDGHFDNIDSIAWSPDGQILASASDDQKICLWDVDEERLSATIEVHTKPIVCIAFCYDGLLLASKSLDGTVRLWQCETGEELAQIDEPASGWRGRLAFHPHAPRLATLGGKDTIVRIWDLNIDSLFNTAQNCCHENILLSPFFCPALLANQNYRLSCSL
ncbi:MAG TPA: WD40 repeat domain-containing protein [Ktedonobacteraceae bacterium]|nr:WD40 repeat domain-containing protein [Ktedonobacteraceae bacterium]